MASSIILVLDVETTGINPRVHEVIDLWAVALDARKLSVLWQAGGRVKPRNIAAADPEVLRVNRYDAETWKEEKACDLPIVWKRVTDRLGEKTVARLCGHNPAFDERMLYASLTRLGQPTLCWWGQRLVDTASLALPAQKAGWIKNRQLETVAGFFVPGHVRQAHWPADKRHGARADARITAAVLRQQLSRTSKWDTEWEKALWPDEELAPSTSFPGL